MVEYKILVCEQIYLIAKHDVPQSWPGSGPPRRGAGGGAGATGASCLGPRALRGKIGYITG